MEAKKGYRFYGQESSGEEDETRYEVTKVPLQDEIASIRRVVSKSWNKFIIEKNKLSISARTNTTKVQDAIKSVGVKDTRMFVQVSAIGSSALLGALLARKKSGMHKIMYPILSGSGVWGIFYCTVPQNRTRIYSEIDKLQNKIRGTKSKK